jgi:hypothetical protein
LIDVTDPAAVRAEAERRRELLARGAKSFDASLDPIAAAGARVVDEAELGKLEKEIEHACDKLVLSLGGKRREVLAPGQDQADARHRRSALRLSVAATRRVVGVQSTGGQTAAGSEAVPGGRHELRPGVRLGGLGDLKQWLVARGVVAGFNADGTPIPHPRS